MLKVLYIENVRNGINFMKTEYVHTNKKLTFVATGQINYPNIQRISIHTICHSQRQSFPHTRNFK